MIWMPLALAASGLQAYYSQINRHYQLPGLVLNLYRGIIPFVLLLPFLLWFPPPEAWQFYGLTAVNGLLVSFSDARFFDATARFGSAPVLRLKPLVLILVFLLWLPLDPEHTQKLFHNVPLALGIMTCLVGACISLFMMTRCVLSAATLRYLMPVILASVVIETVNKLTTSYSHGVGGAVSYAVMLAFFCLLFLLPRLLWAQMSWAVMLQSHYRSAGMRLGIAMVGFNVVKNIAMAATPNPAFVTAIIFCSGLWSTLWRCWRGQVDQENWKMALFFVLSTVSLVILGSLL